MPTTLVRITEDLVSTYDFRKISEFDVLVDAIVKAIYIKKGTYICDPEVGSLIRQYVFELADQVSLDLIKNEVEQIVRQIPQLRLHNISVLRDAKDPKSVIIEILVQYQELKREVSIRVGEKAVGVIKHEEIVV